MSAQHIANLLDNGKHVSFYVSSEKGKYVCQICSNDKNKEGQYIFGNTIEEIMCKLERKTIQKDEPQ